MADTNPQPNSSSNSPQKPNDQKPGLSWSQPANSSQQSKPAQNNKPASATMPSNGDSSGRVIGIIVGIVVVFALAAWGIAAIHNRSTSNPTAMSTTTSEEASSTDTGSTSEVGATTPTPSPVPAVTPTPTPTATPTPTPAPVTTGSNSTFAAASPQDAGTAVAVSNMNLSAPTWIIVYESHNGTPGNILGAGLFFPGDTSATVELLRATTAGQTYLVTAAVDNGDKLFSIKDEKPVVDSSGKQVWITVQTR